MKEAMETAIGRADGPSQFRSIEYLNIIGTSGRCWGLLGNRAGGNDRSLQRHAGARGAGERNPIWRGGILDSVDTHVFFGTGPCRAVSGGRLEFLRKRWFDRLTVRGALPGRGNCY